MMCTARRTDASPAAASTMTDSKTGLSPLMFTSRVTLLAVIAIVLGAGTLGRAAGRSDVADAVMKGDKAALRALLQQNADVNAPQIDGATALHWAVYRDDLEAAGALIAAGANVDVANREAVTPLAM